MKISDAEISSKADAFRGSLPPLEASASALKNTYASIAATSTPLIALAMSKKEVEAAVTDQLRELTLDEKKKLAAAPEMNSGLASDFEKAATLVANMTYKSSAATQKGAVLATAMREHAKAMRAADGLQEKLETLEKDYVSKKARFVAARSTMKAAWGAVGQSCASAK